VSTRSAGLLLYRHREGVLEVLLVHPGGPLWAHRDAGAWSIPKGEYGSEDAFTAAQREFTEETGAQARGTFHALTPVRQAGGKLVTAWAVESEFDPAHLRSNTFELEWPPRSGRRQTFPEIDRAGWFPAAVARAKISAGQRPLIDELEQRLAG
jgi:predicted NUDIX family NTP pyrophosphohydrolase